MYVLPSIFTAIYLICKFLLQLFISYDIHEKKLYSTRDALNKHLNFLNTKNKQN